jgi:hypothetical protein
VTKSRIGLSSAETCHVGESSMCVPFRQKTDTVKAAAPGFLYDSIQLLALLALIIVFK